MQRPRWIACLRAAVILAVAAAALPPAPAGAFTLINGNTALFIRPSNGLASAPLNVLGTWQAAGNQCAPAPPITFRFNFDSTEVWAVNVSICDPNTFVWTSGWSPNFRPPAGSAPGGHKITVNVYGPPGNVLLPGGTKVGTYTINRPPPSPSPPPPTQPSPTQPSPSPVASPSTSQCQTAAALPASDTGGFVDNFIAGAMVAAVLPILGLALFGSPLKFLAAVGRRRKIFQLLGLGLLVVGVLSCTSSVAQGTQTPVAQVTPSQAASPSPSPSASPSCATG